MSCVITIESSVFPYPPGTNHVIKCDESKVAIVVRKKIPHNLMEGGSTPTTYELRVPPGTHEITINDVHMVVDLRT